MNSAAKFSNSYQEKERRKMLNQCNNADWQWTVSNGNMTLLFSLQKLKLVKSLPLRNAQITESKEMLLANCLAQIPWNTRAVSNLGKGERLLGLVTSKQGNMRNFSSTFISRLTKTIIASFWLSRTYLLSQVKPQPCLIGTIGIQHSHVLAYESYLCHIMIKSRKEKFCNPDYGKIR